MNSVMYEPKLAYMYAIAPFTTMQYVHVINKITKVPRNKTDDVISYSIHATDIDNNFADHRWRVSKIRLVMMK